MQRKGFNKDNEWNLLQDFIGGDPQAARMFFEKYGGIIKYIVRKVGVDNPVIDKEDLFQKKILVNQGLSLCISLKNIRSQ